MNRRILILGARVYQLPLIRKALSLGHTVHVASYDQNDPGMKIAHKAWTVDTTDKENILAICRENQIDMIITVGTDVAVPTIGYVNERLKLRGFGYQTGIACTNKIIMQQCFKRNNIPSAASYSAASPREAQDALARVGLPAIIKAPDSSGSRGIRVINSELELDAAYHTAQSVSRTGSVLVEELIIGEEFGAQAVVSNGEVVELFCHNDTVTNPPVTVPIGHSVSVKFNTSVVDEVSIITERAVQALGVCDAVCNCDFIFCPTGVKVLEIGARLGATGIPEIIKEYYGVDLWETTISLAMGEGYQPGRTIGTKPFAVAARLIESPHSGKIMSQNIPAALVSDPNLLSLELDYSIGDCVRSFKVGPDRIGLVVVRGSDVDSAETFAEQAANSIQLNIDDENKGEH